MRWLAAISGQGALVSESSAASTRWRPPGPHWQGTDGVYTLDGVVVLIPADAGQLDELLARVLARDAQATIWLPPVFEPEGSLPPPPSRQAEPVRHNPPDRQIQTVAQRRDGPSAPPAPAARRIRAKARRRTPPAGTAPFEGADRRPSTQEQVLSRQLSSTVAAWVRSYSRLGERDLYLWQWCLHGLELTTLPCVLPALCGHLRDTKLLAVMLGVLLDDIADQTGDDRFLQELLNIIRHGARADFRSFSHRQQAYARFTTGLWRTVYDRLRGYPCFDDYEELLDYDHQQIANTMYYSCLVNRRLDLLNLPEHDMYMPHNMQMMSFATMDLMCSPGFDRSELGKLREVVWHAQCMGRIGNLVSTWQREITDRDFTSGVFARALARGDLTLEDLRRGERRQLEAAVRRGRHEQYFLRRWEHHRRRIQSMRPRMRSIDLDKLLAALEQLIEMELDSRGCK